MVGPVQAKNDVPDARQSATTASAGRARLVALSLAIACLTLASGCVERRMTIRTNPPGALAYVDDYEVGITPVSTSFLYYGTRKIRLVKDGYETLTVLQPMPTPWYEIPPADFVSENLIFGKLHDQRTFDFLLKPQVVVPTEQLMGRAEALRRGSQSSAANAALTSPGLRVNAPQRGAIEPPPGYPTQPPAIQGPPVTQGAPIMQGPPMIQGPPATAPQSINQIPPSGVPASPGASPPPGYQVPSTGPPAMPGIGGLPTYQLPPSGPEMGR